VTTDERLDLRVRTARYESATVNSYELVRPDGGPLPQYSAGAHVDLHLPNGLVRSYSLCGDERAPDRYVIGVGLDANSRGGSSWIHQNLRPGQFVSVSSPRNNFPLDRGEDPVVLIAGGIGITPLLGMVRHLAVTGREWRLHYAVRAREHAAFLHELQELAKGSAGEVALHVDDEAGQVLEVEQVVAQRPLDAHLYACGPEPMLRAFDETTRSLSPERCHVEHFSNAEAPATDGGFELTLVRSGTTVRVESGQTILDAVRSVGVDVAYSCLEGVCGTCEVKLLGGEADHRDLVLSDEEKQSNNTIMICCSGSRSARLELDL